MVKKVLLCFMLGVATIKVPDAVNRYLLKKAMLWICWK